MINIRTIIDAWATRLSPTEQEKALAEDRLSVCNDCPFKTTFIGFEICTQCGCQLSTKVFVPLGSDERCPKNFWKQ